MSEYTDAVLEKLLYQEMYNAYMQFGDFHSSHELWGVLQEEEEEYRTSVKENNEDLYELLQLAGVAFRYIRQKAERDPDYLKKIEARQCERWPNG